MKPAVWFGADVLLHRPEGAAFRERLRGRRVALLAHPASVDARMQPVWELIGALPDVRLTALLSPQHGFAGEKQDDMVESADAYHSTLRVPILSLYGDTRRLRTEWIDRFDVLLFDLQDVGVRVYTFLTTLGYLLEDLAGRADRELWVLDRPNPAGRCVEGLALQPGQESFVGLAPMPMQHGMTMGECASWYRRCADLGVRLEVVPMLGWDPLSPWPADRVWLQPSPNMPAVTTARAYPGTVLLEGTTLSEGRGTTRPLSLVGHPRVDWTAVRRRLEDRCPELLAGLVLRDVSFEPTFHKHVGKQCSRLRAGDRRSRLRPGPVPPVSADRRHPQDRPGAASRAAAVARPAVRVRARSPADRRDRRRSGPATLGGRRGRRTVGRLG